MKKFLSFAVFIVIILLINVHFASAASIGLRPLLQSKNYIALDSSLLLSISNSTTNKTPWSFNVSSKFSLSPSSHIRFYNSTSHFIYNLDTSPITQISNYTSLNYSYILGSTIVFDIYLRVSFIFSNGIAGWSPEFTLANNYKELTLSMEYIFLNRPTYQVGLKASASIGYVSISLLGGVNIFENLELRGSSLIDYLYIGNLFHGAFSVDILYKKDLLTANFSYRGFDLTNQFSSSSNNIFYLTLSSRLPIIENLTALLSGSLTLQSAASYVLFDVSAGAEYFIISDLALSLSYSMSTDFHSYTHRISLGAKYTF